MSSYQTTAYTHIHELIDTWTRHAQAIETQVKSLSEKARVLGTSADTPETRARLDEDERRLHDLASKSKVILKDLANEMIKRKKELSKEDMNMITKVKNAMTTALQKYEKVVTDISKQRQQFQNPSNNALIDFGDDGGASDDIHQFLQSQQQMRMQNDILMRENEEQFQIEEQIQEVQRDVVEINQIMRDIGAIVSEQSPIIAGVEERVSAANDNIVSGNRELQGASRSQKKYRKKLCWLLIILLIVAVIITVVIVLRFKP